MANDPPSWKLAPKIASQTQGLVVTGFGTLPTGRALFLEFDWPDDQSGGAWLETLQRVAPITPAVPPEKRAGAADEDRAAALALGWRGLERMGLGETALASFSRPFREGMFQVDRLRRLGDRREGVWQPTVVSGGPVWSANAPGRKRAPGIKSAFDVPQEERVEEHPLTPVTVHALLLLYTRDEADAGAWAQEVTTALSAAGVSIVRSRSLVLDVEKGSLVSREHFGFADGLSQPVPSDEHGAMLLDGKPLTDAGELHGVPLGEFLCGYENGHGEPAPGPVVPQESEDDPDRADDRPKQAGLPRHPLAEGFYDLGRNGTYMVVRELKQDVAAFWNSMEQNADAIVEQDPQHSSHITSKWIAERVIGRDLDGHLLCPDGSLLACAASGYPDNDFYFWERDRFGLGCPPGSHVRRGNPRDGLAPNKKSREQLLKAANNHRILRRGRKFGKAMPKPRDKDDGEDRGLLFMCLNTDIARQFEFVQQTWLLNDSFATLYKEVDPLLGPPGPMTIREDPLRRVIHVETYVRLVGGDYFFLPSLSALRYLALL